MSAAKLADLPRVQRVEVVDPFDIECHNRPQRDRVAERVEERQDAHHDVRRVKIDYLANRLARCEQRCRRSA